jgi:hypothetical protein
MQKKNPHRLAGNFIGFHGLKDIGSNFSQERDRTTGLGFGLFYRFNTTNVRRLLGHFI